MAGIGQFLKDWSDCQTRWFHRNLHLHPDESDGIGLESRYTNSNLLVGSLVHTGLENWYFSGWRDGEDSGEYSLEAAIEGARAHLKDREEEWDDPAKRDSDWSLTEHLLFLYHEHYGPNGTVPDYPRYRVLPDNEGRPFIERAPDV